jgi:hypothetical protein
MKPIPFPQQTMVLAREQPQYQPLPVYRGDDYEFISCWHLTWWERIKLLFTGRIWHRQKTFSYAYQPVLLEVENPWRAEPMVSPQQPLFGDD